jgi:hypothetical protein
VDGQVLALRTAAGCYAASCALGALVGAGAVDSSGFRWAHHALFGATAATALAAASSALWGRRRPGVLLAPALLAWALLPRVAAPSPGHLALAAWAGPWYAAALAALRRA